MNESPEIIIASHSGADFDSLASMIAAQKLYPGSQPLLVAGADENVREFLSLYSTIFNVVNVGDVNFENVNTVVVTDTGQKRRLGKKVSSILDNKDIKVILWDHHVSEEKDFAIDEYHQEEFGSATTIILRELFAQDIEINPMEATLFALGVYEDTGSLTYTSTTSQDLEIVAKLIQCGARLDIVTRYLTHQLDPPQRQLLQKMLLNVREMVINGRNITFTTAKMNLWVKELALLTHKVKEMENADVIFSVVEMKDKVYVVGRSRYQSVDVSEALGHFGGGGHPAAASATVPGGRISKVLPNLIDILREVIPPGITARDIMSTPVVTIDPDETIDSAFEKMVKNGHSGLIVIDESEDTNISGLLSRKDVDKGRSHKLGHAPVKSVMSRKVITVTESTTIEEMQDMVIDMNIGRLPVMFGGKISGIVTRSDILRAIHKKTMLSPTKRILSEEERTILLHFSNLDARYRRFIEVAGEIGDKLGYQVYLVGGIVRDLILGRENLDIDFLIDGSGEEFAKEFGETFEAHVDFNERFQTAKIHFPDDYHVDIAMCRSEYYEKPGALPDVAPSGIRDDLYRRDFTINALAIRLNANSFGELIDFFRCADDLRDKRIRSLHPLSFIDDPTRIFRAIRFEGRLGFRMDEETIRLARHALSDNILENIAPERVRNEIILILKEQNPASCILRGEEVGLWKSINFNIKIQLNLIDPFDSISNIWDKYFTESINFKKWRAYLPVIFVNLGKKNLFKLLEAMNFEHPAEITMKSLTDNALDITTKLDGKSIDDARDYVPVLGQLRPEALAFFAAFVKDKREISSIVSNYLDNLRDIKIDVNGNDLIELGHKPSPLFKEAFREAYYQKVEGTISGRQEELEFTHKYLISLEEKTTKS